MHLLDQITTGELLKELHWRLGRPPHADGSLVEFRGQLWRAIVESDPNEKAWKPLHEKEDEYR